MGQLLERATEARDFISNPDNWLQGVIAEPFDSFSLTPDVCKQADKVCSVGALWRYDLIFIEGSWIAQLANKLAGEKTGLSYFSVYNDSHTHAEVMEFWDELLLRVKEHEDSLHQEV